MKNFLLFLALVPVALFAGEWSKQFVEADELLGNTTSYYKYVYQDGEKAFVFRTDKADQFYILSPNVLDCHNYSGRVGCIVKVGLYDGNGKMVDSFDMFLGEWNNQCTAIGTFDCDFMSQPVGQQKKTRKIFKHLRGSDGYVRIVVDSYSHGLYDLRVTPLKIEE